MLPSYIQIPYLRFFKISIPFTQNPWIMRSRFHLLIYLFFALIICCTACRTDPKVPVVLEDTVVNMRVSGDPLGLNYLLNYDGTATLVMRQLFLPLMDFNPASYELEPILVKGQPVIKEITEGTDKGLLSYTFELNEAATWGDGTPITAKDVAFTLKAIYNPHYTTPYTSYFMFVKRVEIAENNPKGFTIFAEKNNTALPNIGNVSVLPAHILDPNNVYTNYSLAGLKDPKNKEKYSTDPQLKAVAEIFTSPKNMGREGELNGSGPYKLSKWETGKALTIVKKDNWWGDALAKNNRMLEAKPKKIVYKIIPDLNATLSLMRNSEVDVMNHVSVGEFNKLKADPFFKENYNFYAPKMFAHRFIMFNTTDSRLEDKRVRRAIAHLLNLEEVYKTVYGGDKSPVTTPIHPTKPYYNKNLAAITYNIDKAKALLKEAGWADANNNGILDKTIDGELQELNLRLTHSNGFKDYINIAALFQESAKAAGVNIIPTPLESSRLQQGWVQKEYELSFRGTRWYPFHKNLYHNWHSKSKTNFSAFGTSESDALVEEINKTIDEDKLAELYTRFQEIIYEEQPVIFINTASDHIVVNKKYGNVTTSAIPPGVFVNEFALQTVPINVNNN